MNRITIPHSEFIANKETTPFLLFLLDATARSYLAINVHVFTLATYAETLQENTDDSNA
jgi:hypothetical protein